MMLVFVAIAAMVAAAAPFEARADGPGAAHENGHEQQQWVRRCGQVAKVSRQMLSKFRAAAALGSHVAESLESSHVRNHNVFVIELTPGEFYAFRYFEYVGLDFANDTKKLREASPYRDWTAAVDDCLAIRWTDVEDVFFTPGQSKVQPTESRVMRFAQVVGLRSNMVEPYKLIHAHTWPGVLAAIREGNIRNYTIFMANVGAEVYLFAYLEYVGSDFKSDMASIGADPDTKAWIKFTDDGCQLPLSTRKPGEWWARMDLVSTVGATQPKTAP